jgi:hypothetical protein
MAKQAWSSYLDNAIQVGSQPHWIDNNNYAWELCTLHKVFVWAYDFFYYRGLRYIPILLTHAMLLLQPIHRNQTVKKGRNKKHNIKKLRIISLKLAGSKNVAIKIKHFYQKWTLRIKKLKNLNFKTKVPRNENAQVTTNYYQGILHKAKYVLIHTIISRFPEFEHKM